MSAHIKVAVRVRPFTESQIASGYSNSFVEVDKRNRQIKVAVKGDEQDCIREFGFDCVLGEKASQEDVYKGCGMDYLVGKAMQGYNSTIFLYGQTGSGKTYTMQGQSVNELGDGVVPRVVESLYRRINQNKSRSFSVSVSYLQVYSEKVYDLLNPLAYNGRNTTPQFLRLRWTKQNQFSVQNLFVFECQTPEELLQHVRQGLSNRVNATHRLNISSSRSHSILTIRVESKQRENPSNILRSCIELVDLAGSERTSLTGSEGRLAKESIDINKSLFTLRQVITSLAEDPEGHIPYRESKLTSLLKHSIGGNCYCLMIACLSPNDLFLDENISTLTYATKASKIKNEPTINRDPQHNQIALLQTQIKELNKELAKATRNNEIVNMVSGRKCDMDDFLRRADGLLGKAEKDKGGAKGENYWLMFLESVSMVRDLLKSNRQLRQETERYKSLLDKRDLEIHQLFRQNEQFRIEMHRSNSMKPLFKRPIKSLKTEHLKTDYSMHQHDSNHGIYVPIVAMLERSRNKAVINTFPSTELNFTTNQQLSEVKELSKRQTQKSFNFINKMQQQTAGVHVRTHSSNDKHDGTFGRRTFHEASPERPGRRIVREQNT